MTGRQHAAIGVGLTLPLGVQVAVGPLAAAGLPGWAIAAGGMPGPLLAALVIGGGLLGALLPDLDTDRSLLEAAPRHGLRGLRRRPWLWPVAPLLLLLVVGLWLVNEAVMLVTAHRGVTHSLTALLLVMAGSWLATAWALGPSLTAGVAVGYTSHLLADALTPRGVPLFAPWSRHHWRLLPRPVSFGGASGRAGCLAALVFCTGIGLAVWQIWVLLRPTQ